MGQGAREAEPEHGSMIVSASSLKETSRLK